MGLFSDLWGTVKGTFQVGIGGVKLKNNSANLEVKAADGTTDAAITTSKVNISGDVLDINSDATSAAADWKYTIQRPATGMSAAVVLTLPDSDGSPSQVLQTDGDGILSWATAGSNDACVQCDTTTVAFGTSSPVALLTLPSNSIVHQVEVVIDTPFANGDPTMSIGVVGTASKYMGTGDINLKGTAKDRYIVHPGEAASNDAMIATLAPGTCDAGSVRVLVYHSVPA